MRHFDCRRKGNFMIEGRGRRKRRQGWQHATLRITEVLLSFPLILSPEPPLSELTPAFSQQPASQPAASLLVDGWAACR